MIIYNCLYIFAVLFFQENGVGAVVAASLFSKMSTNMEWKFSTALKLGK